MAKRNFIKTPLPIVYLIGNKLKIKEGLDLNKKDAVWGIQISDRVILSVLTSHFSRPEAQILAHQLIFNGKHGYLPSKEWFISVEKILVGDVLKKIQLTTDLLAKHVLQTDKIEISPHLGEFWVEELSGNYNGWIISLIRNSDRFSCSKTHQKNNCRRFAVAFD